eukprot:14199273-Alexandrium_andersonii.AAC.1
MACLCMDTSLRSGGCECPLLPHVDTRRSSALASEQTFIRSPPATFLSRVHWHALVTLVL